MTQSSALGRNREIEMGTKKCSRFDFARVVTERASQRLGQDRIHRRDLYRYLGQTFHLRRVESKELLKELVGRGLVEDSKRGIVIKWIKDRVGEET